jgi:undecaprenyl-diphosphatase
MDSSLTEYLQTAILAVIQGAAELLPVSSSAHVIFAEHLMGIDPAGPKATFLLVMLHTGTMGAVLVYFWPRWRRLLGFGNPVSASAGAMPARQFVALVVLATAVTGLLGLGLKLLIEKVVMEGLLHHETGEVELLFRNLWLVGGALAAVGLLILAAGFSESTAASPTLTSRQSIVIGLVQGLCLPFRGFSRSGATISTALFCGVSRTLAEDFSFALAVVLTPPVIALELRRLVKSEDWSRGHTIQLLGPGLVGMVLSFFAGLLALRLLSAALERGRWRYFGVYCLVAAIVLFGYAAIAPSHTG